MALKCKSDMCGYMVDVSTVSVFLRLFIMLSLLLVMSGEVERNPGPTRGGGSAQVPAGRSQGRDSCPLHQQYLPLIPADIQPSS